MHRAGVVLTLAATLTLTSAVPPSAAAQEPQSADVASALRALLDQKKMDAVAARHPDQSDHFIAALYIPGSQLLVVSAPHPQPAALDYRIAEGKYRDVYLDIQGAGTQKGRFFVIDLQADGLRRTAERDSPFDIVYTNGVDQISYDGDWKANKLSEDEYNKRFAADDARYARLLTALKDKLAVQTPPVTPAAPLPDAAR